MYSNKVMKSALETMMFMWGEPLEVKDAAEVLEADRKEIRELFKELQSEYEQEGRGIRIREVDGAFGFVTLADNDMFLKKLCTPVRVRKLSQAALEVLAIIAYRQPVTKGEIDAIRGVKCDRVIDGLQAKGLIREKGRSDAVGRPILYATTDTFLKNFGFEDLSELPEIEDLEGVLDVEEDDEESDSRQMRIDLDNASEEKQGEEDE